jgi:hypothetical protein
LATADDAKKTKTQNTETSCNNLFLLFRVPTHGDFIRPLSGK